MALNPAVQYDALGRPFYSYLDSQGRTQQSYVSPVAMGKTAPADTTGVFRKGPQWNQRTGKWETPIDWSNILNVGVATALTLGAADAGIFGGGAAGFLGGGHAAVGPVLGPPTSLATGVGGLLPATSATALTPLGAIGTATGTGAGVGVGTGVGTGVGVGTGTGAGAGMSWKTLADLGLKYGLPTLGNVIDTKMTTGANADAARIQQEYYEKALAAALEEQAYERKRQEEQTAYDRLHGEENTAYTRQHAAELLGINQGAFGNYLSQLAPYRNAGTTALERMQSALSGSPWQPNNGVTRTFL